MKWFSYLKMTATPVVTQRVSKGIAAFFFPIVGNYGYFAMFAF